ncbi:hypothetical protein Ait01nite_090660 [Actinoplanes italicus]|uniref:Mycothiol-dependent maleylpyruvate isomerase metal-binding domain-containing protein n=1 Tax=Actinoplanes italicus TaxID=113567 RepID=A0A2T0JTL9_9ACTN|nr:maleylpyruvate isomerase N-terminal domain-containing protein [Actinoplanes italicus]PRX10995.1 hypothetical protein CLV67_13253 [Actinoplanes italicus]GIE36021.1 hypothetical protein Ait01nite_090660 [Actinoplanes italicus]
MTSAADVRTAVSLAAGTLRAASDMDWHVPAGDLIWTCWETIEHIADDLFAYAGQIAAENTPASSYVPFGWRRNRPGGPALTIFGGDTTNREGLVQVLESSGGLLAAVVEVAPAERRAFHPYGISDPAGFAAMGVVETVVHLYDVAIGLGWSWAPPEDLCGRALRRLFRDVEDATAEVESRRAALLWAAGRIELPGLPRRENWKWNGTPAT